MGISGGDCLSGAAYPASDTLPPVTFSSEKAGQTICPEGTRFVTYHERLVLLARRYVSAIEPAEGDVPSPVEIQRRRSDPVSHVVGVSATSLGNRDRISGSRDDDLLSTRGVLSPLMRPSPRAWSDRAADHEPEA
jgi:hypothetical protein